jgi:3-oxoacyl-(acyl-carrier-protein) synthase
MSRRPDGKEGTANDREERLRNLTPLGRAVLALKETQERLDALERRLSEPIAIVGMACRFPGGADGPEAYWRLLCEGRDAIGEVPPERWEVEAAGDEDSSGAGEMAGRWGGFLEGIDGFDDRFFGIPEREAELIDPQQRMLLELAFEAIEDAGLAPRSLRGSRVGVFVGISASEYGLLLSREPSRDENFVATGTVPSIAANRISFHLGLTGPSVALDTACSSSLVALHLACQSLRAKECDLALVGGANLMLSPLPARSLARAGLASPNGRVHPFDEAAAGYVRGEGAGMLLLRPLGAALEKGDPIYAIVRGSAVGQSGATNGLTAPSRIAEERVLGEAYRRSGVSPGRVGYVEAHGTGTRLGDAIEALALGKVLAEGRPPGSWAAIGSVKPNIGHLEAAAGVAALIKAALAVERGTIPPTLHFERPSPEIPFDRLPLVVQRSLGPWPEGEGARIAGVSAFGFGGSNAHVVLEQAPAREPRAQQVEGGKRLLVLSAPSAGALDELIRRWRDFLRGSTEEWGAICATAAVGRDHHAVRLALFAASPSEAAETLAALSAGSTPAGSWSSPAPAQQPVKMSVAPTAPPERIGSLPESGLGDSGPFSTLAARYVAGADVDWRALVSDPGGRVHLPTTPWERRRLWAPKSRWTPPAPVEVGAARPFPAGEVPNVSPAAPELSATLPAPGEKRRRPELATPFVPPGTPFETELAAAWSEVLQVEPIGVRDNFFELGGDSLLATILVNRLQERLGELLQVLVLFEAQSIADLVETLRSSHPEAMARIEGGGKTTEAAGPFREERGVIGDGEIALVRRLTDALAPNRNLAPVSSPRNRRAVFVLSPPRSGTTLLRVMLAGHPRLFAPPELELLGFDTMTARRDAYEGLAGMWLSGAVRALMEARGISSEEARGRIAAAEKEGETTASFYRGLQEALGDRLLVDKTPSYSGQLHVLRRIEELFEEPLYIHLVRHPCGMIRSFVDYRMDRTYALRFRVNVPSPFSPRQMGELVWTIAQQNILEIAASVPGERWLQVAFEDLVRDPESTMRRLGDFLGVGFDPAMVRPYENQKGKMVDGAVAEGRMQGDQKFVFVHRSIDPAVADAWRGEDDGARLGLPTRRLAARLGYEGLLGVARPEPIDAGEAARLLGRVDRLSDDEVLELLERHLESEPKDG